MKSITNLLLQTHLNQIIIALNPTSMFQSLSLPYAVRKMANIDRPSFNAERFSASENSSVKKANQFCDFFRTVLDMHAHPSLRKVIAHNYTPWIESMRDEHSIAKRERRQAERK